MESSREMRLRRYLQNRIKSSFMEKNWMKLIIEIDETTAFFHLKEALTHGHCKAKL